MGEYVPIPQEKAQIALATCLQNPALARYYENAPEGARAYIALEFYLNVYGEEVEDAVAASYYQEIETNLTTPDFAYLIKHERDPEIKDHLLDLMTRRSAPKKKMALRRVAEVKAQAPAVPPAAEPVAPQMQLRQADFHGAQTKQEQHYANEAVAAAEARWQAEERKRKGQAWRGVLKSLLSTLVLVVILVALGWYLYERLLSESTDRAKISEAPGHAGDGASTSSSGHEARARERMEEERRAKAKAQERERKRIAAEKMAQRAKEEETRKLVRSRKDAYVALVRNFANATMDYWKNAPAEDRPGKAQSAMTYHGLVPVAEGAKYALLELFCEPGKPMSIKRLKVDADPVELTLEDFNKMVSQVPYLVLRGDKSYFCSQKKPEESYSLQGKDVFNPSEMAFGDLYGVMNELHLRRPNFKWLVQLLPQGTEKPIDIDSVGFGVRIVRGRFSNRVRDVLREEAQEQARVKAVNMAARKARFKHKVVMYSGRTIRDSLGGLTEVPYVCPYDSSSRQAEKWRSLRDEALRQERALHELEQAKTSRPSVRVTDQEVEEVLNSGKVIFKPAE